MQNRVVSCRFTGSTARRATMPEGIRGRSHILFLVPLSRAESVGRLHQVQRFKVNLPVFVGSVAVIALFVGIGVIAPKRAESIFSGMQTAILSGFGWLYLLSVAIFLFSMLFLAFSRYG